MDGVPAAQLAGAEHAGSTEGVAVHMENSETAEDHGRRVVEAEEEVVDGSERVEGSCVSQGPP